MNSTVGPIFNIFFLNKVAVGLMNSAWIVLLQCMNSDNCLLKLETREKKKKKRKEKQNANVTQYNSYPNTHLILEKRVQIYNFAPSINLFIKRRENIGESSPVKKKKCTFTTLPIFLICLLGAILTNLVSQFFFFTYIK